MDHNGHDIEVSVRAVSGGWIADVVITYNEKGKSMRERLPVDQTFANPNDAEQRGIEYAKKWIDNRVSNMR